MQLENIYRPIKKELGSVEAFIGDVLNQSRHKSILEINNFLLEARGKRIRPALVILCAKASKELSSLDKKLIKIATAIELIHIASLIHDDIIDHASLRHNKPTINYKWGDDVSIVAGDYLYSIAFDLISSTGNSDILKCISSATKALCEGQLLQVCERDNLNLLKERYFIIVKMKTASLFAASCQSGALISNPKSRLKIALKEFGLNFGIAFQIIDDYLDIVGVERFLGKAAGQDMSVGEFTLPILNLWESIPLEERRELEGLLATIKNKETLERIRQKLFDSGAASKTKNAANSFIISAKQGISFLPGSPYKDSLIGLSDFILKRGFGE